MSVLNEFKEAIFIQQKKEDESYNEQIKLPIEERVAKGNTMNNMKVVFDFFDQAPNQYCPRLNHPLRFIQSAKVYCQNNISTFREGGQVQLSNGSYAFKMEILEDTIDNFIIAPNDFDVKYCYIDSENYNQNNWEINVVKTDLTLKLLSATAGNLENDNTRLNKIEKLLSGKLENSRSSNFQYAQLNIRLSPYSRSSRHR
jgi:DNA replication ATP-dependent helicase Dna2